MTSYNANNVNITELHPIKAELAPMAGFTDAVFRRLCSRYGAESVVSEMISAFALTMNDKKTAALAQITQGESPVILQIFGHDPVIMAQAADILLSGSFSNCSYAASPAGIDINMGCPVKKIFSSGDGSALMKSPETAARITYAVKNVCEKHGVPLSVKFRLGIDSDSMNYSDFGVAVAMAGADKLTLHCRTRAQMYAPSADPTHCRRLSDALAEKGLRHRITLCGNGDICSHADGLRYLENGCDSVAIGRGALGDPWLFTALTSPNNYTPPTPAERVAAVKAFVTEVVSEKGEVVGIRESRSRAAYFIKGIRGAAQLRDRLNRSDTLEDFLSILDTAEY